MSPSETEYDGGGKDKVCSMVKGLAAIVGFLAFEALAFYGGDRLWIKGGRDNRLTAVTVDAFIGVAFFGGGAALGVKSLCDILGLSTGNGLFFGNRDG